MLHLCQAPKLHLNSGLGACGVRGTLLNREELIHITKTGNERGLPIVSVPPVLERRWRPLKYKGIPILPTYTLILFFSRIELELHIITLRTHPTSRTRVSKHEAPPSHYPPCAPRSACAHPRGRRTLLRFLEHQRLHLHRPQRVRQHLRRQGHPGEPRQLAMPQRSGQRLGLLDHRQLPRLWPFDGLCVARGLPAHHLPW